MKSCLEQVCFKVAPKRVNVSVERIESGREFQIVGQLHGKSENCSNVAYQS